MSEKKILVVDDEPDLRTLYEITLQRCGYAVCSAGDLEQARDLLQRKRFAVLVTDMRLPDGQGLELIEWLQQNQRAERGIVENGQILAYRTAVGGRRHAIAVASGTGKLSCHHA